MITEVSHRWCTRHRGRIADGPKSNYRHVVGRGRHGNLDDALGRDKRNELSGIRGTRGRGVETWAAKGADKGAVAE